MKITPIERRDNYFFKRDDYYQIAGVCGGKARTCWHLAKNAKGLITAGSRQSPQVKIVANIAKHKNIPCHIHTPSGAFTPVLQSAIDAGAKLFQHKPGYNSVIIKRAKDDTIKTDYTYIPFGMECEEAVIQTKEQVKNIPKEVRRIVITVGSGMSLVGVLVGLNEQNINIPVLAVCVGADPLKRIHKFGKIFYTPINCIFEKSIYDYHSYYREHIFMGIDLDPIYEAKCLPYLREYDLLWIIGRR